VLFGVYLRCDVGIVELELGGGVYHSEIQPDFLSQEKRPMRRGM
jgi:hypothetical protein